MKIYFTVTLFSLIFIIKAYSQDLIIKKNGDNIKCKVIEISLTEVKYKKFENIDGPIYTLLSKEIESIKYENGTKDIFNGYKKNKIPFKFIDTSRIRYNIVKKKTISFFELSSFFNSEPGIFKSFIYNTRDPRLSYTTYYTNPLSIKFIEGIKFNNIFILGLSLEYTNIKPYNFFTAGSDIFINTSKQKNTPYINLNYGVLYFANNGINGSNNYTFGGKIGYKFSIDKGSLQLGVGFKQINTNDYTNFIPSNGYFIPNLTYSF